MMTKRDPGLSMAVGFVMILLVIAMVIGIWAVVGVPEQIRDAEEYHAVKVMNAFLDYKIAADSQLTGGLTGSNVSMLIPAASAYAGGALFLEEDAGTLRVSIGASENITQISRLYATFGTTNTKIGYEAGGVYRNDYGHAVWVTPPSLTIDNSYGDLYVKMVAAEMPGSFSAGSSEGIPVDTLLEDLPSPVFESVNQTIIIAYSSDDPWDVLLWSAFFNETKIKYQHIWIENITVELTGNTTSIRIPQPSDEFVNLTMIRPKYCVNVRRY